MKGQKLTSPEWQELGEKRLKKTLKACQRYPMLSQLGPKTLWKTNLVLVGKPAITKLNISYRGKKSATDVLSFPAPSPFWESGILGELIICLPVLKEQARSLGLPPQVELDVLLVHGILHLLGFDHEKGPKEAREMAKWEARLLGPCEFGLIDRVESAIKGK